MPFKILSEEDRAALLGVPTNDQLAELLEGLEERDAVIAFHEDGGCSIRQNTVGLVMGSSFSATAKVTLAILELMEAISVSPNELDDRILLDNDE